MTVREPRAPVGPWVSPEDRAEAWERYHVKMDEYHEACDRAEDERRDRMAMEAILTAGVTATREANNGPGES